jgi:putative ABC transport system permease protein
LITFAFRRGIIEIALILSLSNGFQSQIDQFQVNAISEFLIILVQAEINLIEVGLF